MGADTSRFYASSEEGSDLDSYIKGGGARLVNRERQLTTSTTLQLGGVAGRGGGGGGEGGGEGPQEREKVRVEIECLSARAFMLSRSRCIAQFIDVASLNSLQIIDTTRYRPRHIRPGQLNGHVSIARVRLDTERGAW